MWWGYSTKNAGLWSGHLIPYQSIITLIMQQIDGNGAIGNSACVSLLPCARKPYCTSIRKDTAIFSN